MTPKQLKQSILQLAFEGKLVEHINDDVDSLLSAIDSTKRKISIKNKKYPKIDDIEKPFDIPNTWKWVYLSDVAYVNGGFAFKSTEYTENGVRVVRISDFNENGFINNKIVRTKYSEGIDDYKINEKDILLCMTGGTVGKSFFVTSVNEDMYANQRVATIKILNPIKEFINFALLAPFTQKAIQDSKNSTNDNISMDLINTFLIPLPPLEEQKRIVAKIEQLLPLVDRYEEAWNKLEKLNKDFPINLEKSILHFAIEGKLADQRADEGTGEELFVKIQSEKQQLIKMGKIKKEKPLPVIGNDEIPFEIPTSWKWARISTLMNGMLAGGDKPKDFSTINDSKHNIPVVANGITNDGILGFTGKATAYANSITVAGRGTIGFSFFRNYDYCPIVRLIVLYPNSNVDPKYIQYALKALPEESLGTSIPQLTVPMLAPKLIPLPPLEEQKRIVEKIQELLPLCRKLIK